LLIDKDYSPKWKYSSIADVDPGIIDWFFESKWQDEEHPLADLGS